MLLFFTTFVINMKGDGGTIVVNAVKPVLLKLCESIYTVVGDISVWVSMKLGIQPIRRCGCPAR